MQPLIDQILRTRHRRIRKNESIRALVRETRLSKEDLVYPIFVKHSGVREEIPSMPNVHRWPLDLVAQEAEHIMDSGVKAVLLFGLPVSKDRVGSEAYSRDGVIQQAIKRIKATAKDLTIITDVCLCQYTDHGHCGILTDGQVDNDQTLQLLGKVALSHVSAGADMVAPSAMMDHQVHALREELDRAHREDVPIIGYSSKFASAFYGPFREAADSTPAFGDRRGYQIDPANSREALREIQSDIIEGADIVMVKPALAYLDILAKARRRFNVPIAAFSVSGEYAMVKAAARNGWLDEQEAALETLTSIKRAGADLIITYFAEQATLWLDELH
jgi:porphobilinogen synthase